MFAGYFLCAQRENESIRPISFNGPLPSGVSKASQQLKPVLCRFFNNQLYKYQQVKALCLGI